MPDVSAGPHWRSFISFICLAVGILCLITGSLFVWVRVTAYNPDGYVAAALNVQGQVSVRDAVTKYVQDDLFDQQRAESLALKVTERFPIPSAQQTLLAGVLATAVRAQVGNTVDQVLNTPRFQTLLKQASTRASEGVVALLRNEPGVFRFQGDAIVLDMQPLVENVRGELEKSLGGLAPLLPERTEGYKTYTVAQGANVVAVRQAIKVVDLMSWLLPVLFLLLTIVGMLFSRRRHATAFRTAISVAVAAVVVLVGLRITKSIITELVGGSAAEDTVNVIINQVSTRLFNQTLLLALIAALIGGALWLAGPDRTARTSRAWIATRGRDVAAGTPSAAGPVTGFVRRYRPHLEIGGLVLAGIVLSAQSSVGASTLILTLIALVLWYLAIEYTSAASWMTSLVRRVSDRDRGSTT